MSHCTRCGAAFSCGMANQASEPCWCTTLPAAVPVPEEAAGCWCPACLASHIAALTRTDDLPANPQLAENPVQNNEGQSQIVW